MQTRRRIVAVGLGLALSGGALAAGVAGWDFSDNGSLTGTDTVDKVNFSAPQGSRIDYYVSGSGAGSNKLTVKIQQQKNGGGWRTLVEEVLNMPSDSASGSFTVPDYRETTSENLRYRVSRDIGTKAINWYVNHNVD